MRTFHTNRLELIFVAYALDILRMLEYDLANILPKITWKIVKDGYNCIVLVLK